jgi:hypothetical protein
VFPVFIQLCDGSLVQETFEFTFHSIRWISPFNKVASSAHCLIFLSLGAGIHLANASAQAFKRSSQKVHNKAVLHSEPSQIETSSCKYIHEAISTCVLMWESTL